MSVPMRKVVQWMVDTRPLWPVTTPSTKAKDQMLEFKTAASSALSLLPEEEQQAVLRYHYIKDAKMSLASCLLKRLVIAKLCGIPWSEVVVSRNANYKPCFIPKTVSTGGVEFNVSHQAGIVTVVACLCKPGEVQLGTDVVCVNERDDRARIARDGFFSWVDMHSDVFAPSETRALKYDNTNLILSIPDELERAGYTRDAIVRRHYTDTQYDKLLVAFKTEGNVRVVSESAISEAQLRRFYALWCLREAYVKMTGEALLAEWLRELEFRRFRTPLALKAELPALTTGIEPGEVEIDFGIYFKGKRVDDVVTELRAFGKNYMVASAARVKNEEVSGVVFSGWIELDLQKEISAAAKTSASKSTDGL